MKKSIRTHIPKPGIEWAWMEIEAAELATEKAGKHGFAVYCALCILIWKAKSDHKATIMNGITDIMKITGLGKTVVSEAIQKLRKSDLLTVVSGDMKGNSNIYTLHYIGSPDDQPRFASRSTRDRLAVNSGSPDEHQAKGRKDSSATQKKSLSSEKGASAGIPSGSAGDSDSAPEGRIGTGTF